MWEVFRKKKNETLMIVYGRRMNRTPRRSQTDGFSAPLICRSSSLLSSSCSFLPRRGNEKVI